MEQSSDSRGSVIRLRGVDKCHRVRPYARQQRQQQEQPTVDDSFKHRDEYLNDYRQRQKSKSPDQIAQETEDYKIHISHLRERKTAKILKNASGTGKQKDVNTLTSIIQPLEKNRGQTAKNVRLRPTHLTTPCGDASS